jgi:c(7)-type cytochrome triheme protein
MQSIYKKATSAPILFAAALALGLGSPAVSAKTGEEIYNVSCAGCHATGVLEAPKVGTKDDWAKREAQGFETLIKHALEGYNNMPAKGGNPAIKDDEIKAAITHMLVKSGYSQYAKSDPSTPAAAAAPAKPAPAPVAVAPKKKKPAAKPKKVKKRSVNRFNRLMKSSSEWNLPPSKDGIHDPENEGTDLLQPPKDAFANLPKASSGNRVDWVKSLEEGLIEPRYDRLDPDVAPVVMDLNIVREVKGSMPNVVYPHKQHTEWLDCSNCHPAIFIPQKGANQISMAAILLGQKCGVCHGKVAFPVSECRKCHSQKKTAKR